MPTILHPGFLLNQLINQEETTSELEPNNLFLQEDGIYFFLLEDGLNFLALE